MNPLCKSISLQRCITFNKNTCTSNIVRLCFNRSIHQYRNTVPWNNALEFTEHLIASVVYQDNELLVLNKPYGVTFSRSGNAFNNKEERKAEPEEKIFKKPTKKQSIDYANSQYYTSGVVNDSLSLVDCLPYLKKHFGYDKLYLSRVPGKYVSGVAILTTRAELVDRINHIHVRPPTGKDTYLAVVVGVPRSLEGKKRLGFQLEKDSRIGQKPVLKEKWGSNAFKRGEVRIGTFHYQTLCCGFNSLTSLVEVRVDLRKYNALRVFAADYLLAPVLGDNLYGSRVQTLLGVPTTVHHFSEAALRPQKLPEEMYSLLDLNPCDAGIIPVHIHMSEMVLPKFFNGKDLILKAPIPPHFQWTCNKLGLTEEQNAILAF